MESGGYHLIPAEMERCFYCYHAGAKVKALKSIYKPSVIMRNVNFLNQNISVSSKDLPGFTLIQSDRDIQASGKKKGGGLALFVIQRWRNPAHIPPVFKMPYHRK